MEDRERKIVIGLYVRLGKALHRRNAAGWLLGNLEGDSTERTMTRPPPTKE
jgi:hypothetical protein